MTPQVILTFVAFAVIAAIAGAAAYRRLEKTSDDRYTEAHERILELAERIPLPESLPEKEHLDMAWARITDLEKQCSDLRNKVTNDHLLIIGKSEHLDTAWVRITDLEKQCSEIQDQCAKLRTALLAKEEPPPVRRAKNWREVQDLTAVDEDIVPV